MEVNEQIKIRFMGIDFPAVQVKSTKPFKESDENKLKVGVTPKVFLPDSESNTFKVIISVEMTGGECFNLHVVGVGSFELSKQDITEDERKSLINVNSIAIVFPYVRAFIANLTANLGNNITTPISLPVQFFKGDIELLTEQENMQFLK